MSKYELEKKFKLIPNDRLLELSDRSIGIIEAFKTADTALLAGVQGHH